MSIFKLSTGGNAASETKSGEFDSGGGNFDPIPDGTKVRAIITESKWKEYQGARYINLQWQVVDGEFKKRVIFQKVKVFENDAAKADRQKMMLAAIDANCGGKLALVDGEPDDMDLTKALTNKPMVIKLAVWDMDGKTGNWVQAVESGKAKPASAEKKEHAPEKKKPEPTPEPDEGEDIPF